MKKLILFLTLFSILSIQAQVSTGQEQEFETGIKNNAAQTVTTPINVVTQGNDGTLGKTLASNLIEVLEFSTASAMPVTGVSGKIYVTIDSGRLYRWNGTVYNELLSVKENLANKQNSLTIDGTGVKYPTVDAVNTGLSSKIGGSGTIGTLPIFTTSGTLSNSFATQTTTDININGNIVAGTSSPVANVRAFFESSSTQPTMEMRNSSLSTAFTYAGFRFTPNIGYYIQGKLNSISTGYKNIKSSDTFLFNVSSGNISFLNDRVGTGNINFAVNGNTSPSLTIEVSGNSLFKTNTDDGVNTIQVPNGTISALPATLSNQVVVKSQLDLKANIASPTFTGVPNVPTAAAGTNTTQIASTAFVSSSVAGSSNWSRSGSLIYPINTTDIVIIGDNTQTLGAALKVRALTGSTNHAHFFNNANTLITSITNSGISTSSISANSTVAASQFSMNSEQGIYDNLYGKQFRPLSTHWLSNGQIRYQSDYSASYDARTLVDRGYIDNNTPKQLKDFYTDVNNVGITETDLYSYTTTASRLNAAGEKIVAVYGGTMNDVTASSQLKVYFGGTLIGDTGVLTMNAIIDFKINVSIIRTGATTARAILNIATRGASTPSYTEYTALTGLTFTNTNILKVTGTASGATGGDNDITATYGNIIWQPAAL